MRGKAFFLSIFLWKGALLCGAAESTDFRLFLQEISPGEVTVLGSWTVDGIQGWSWGLCHDPEAAQIKGGQATGQSEDPCAGSFCPGVCCTDDMLQVGPSGQEPAFHEVRLFENGVIQGVVLDFGAQWTIPQQERFAFLTIRYELRRAEAELRFCDTLGEFPVRTVFVVQGRSIAPAQQEELVLREALFIRGDANADGAVNVADAVSTLTYLFGGGMLLCEQSADANDDGAVNVGDAVRVLTYLFAGAGAFPAPFPHCGGDPSVHSLSCESFPACP